MQIKVLILVIGSFILPWVGELKANSDFIDLNKITPREFMALLSESVNQVVVFESKKDWIKPAEAAWLIQLLDSDSPCVEVSVSSSSTLVAEKSSVGHEAAFMLLGFFKGSYPPDLQSRYNDLGGKKKVEEILALSQFPWSHPSNGNFPQKKRMRALYASKVLNPRAADLRS